MRFLLTSVPLFFLAVYSMLLPKPISKQPTKPPETYTTMDMRPKRRLQTW